MKACCPEQLSQGLAAFEIHQSRILNALFSSTIVLHRNRIGTADIYRAIELGVPEVQDCVAASLREPDGGVLTSSVTHRHC